MSNVIKLINGGAIQVRTGVLAGVGPEGPRGLLGPRGFDGQQGPQGEIGPMGQILQRMTQASISTTQTVAPSTDVLLSFGSVSYDDLSAASSATNFRLELGDYLLCAWIKFELPANAADGHRTLFFSSSVAGQIARTGVAAVQAGVTYVNITWPYRCTTANEIINLYARSGDDLALTVSQGTLAITRIGSGPKGDVGPAGPQGPQGAAGVQGVQGPAGNAGGKYTTYGGLWQ